MRVLILVVVLALVSLTSAGNVPWKNCGSSSDHVKITALTAVPFPPTKGKPVTVTVSGSLDEEVTSGKYDIKVSYLGIQLLSKTGSICDLDPSKFPCPQKAGDITIGETLTIPSEAPSGEYAVTVSATDQNSQELLCVDLSLNLQATVAKLDLGAPAVSA